MDSASDQQEIDATKLKEGVITEELMANAEGEADRVVLVEGGDSSTAEEQVLGYLEVQPSDLQAVTEGGTIYLSSEDLDQHLILAQGDEGGEYIVVVGSEEEALAALASAEGELKLQTVQQEDQRSMDNITETEQEIPSVQFVQDDISLQQNVSKLVSQQVLMEYPEGSDEQTEFLDSAQHQLNKDVTLIHHDITSGIVSENVIEVEGGEIRFHSNESVFATSEVEMQESEFTQEVTVNQSNETPSVVQSYIEGVETVPVSSSEVDFHVQEESSIHVSVIESQELVTETKTAEDDTQIVGQKTLEQSVQEVNTSNQTERSNEIDGTEVISSDVSYATSESKNISASPTIVLLDVKPDSAPTDTLDISVTQDSVSNTTIEVVEHLPHGLNQLLEAVINVSNQESEKEAHQESSTKTVSTTTPEVMDVIHTQHQIISCQTNVLGETEINKSAIFSGLSRAKAGSEEAKQVKEKCQNNNQIDSYILKPPSKKSDSEEKLIDVKRTVICVTPKDQTSLQKAEDLAHKLSGTTHERNDSTLVTQARSSPQISTQSRSPVIIKTVHNENQISLTPKLQKSLHRKVSPSVDAITKLEASSIKAEVSAANKLQVSLQTDKFKQVPVTSAPARVCKPAIVRLSRADAPRKDLICSAKTSVPNILQVNDPRNKPKTIIVTDTYMKGNISPSLKETHVVSPKNLSKLTGQDVSPFNVASEKGKTLIRSNIKVSSVSEKSSDKNLSVLRNDPIESIAQECRATKKPSILPAHSRDSPMYILPVKAKNVSSNISDISTEKLMCGSEKIPQKSSIFDIIVTDGKTLSSNVSARTSKDVDKSESEQTRDKDPLVQKISETESEKKDKSLASPRSTRGRTKLQQDVDKGIVFKNIDLLPGKSKQQEGVSVLSCTDEPVSQSKKSTPEKFVDRIYKPTRSRISQVTKSMNDSDTVKVGPTVDISKPNRCPTLFPASSKSQSKELLSEVEKSDVFSEKQVISNTAGLEAVSDGSSICVKDANDLENPLEVPTIHRKTEVKSAVVKKVSPKEALDSEFRPKEKQVIHPQLTETGVMTRRGQRKIPTPQPKDRKDSVSLKSTSTSLQDTATSEHTISTKTKERSPVVKGKQFETERVTTLLNESISENISNPELHIKSVNSKAKEKLSLEGKVLVDIKTRRGSSVITGGKTSVTEHVTKVCNNVETEMQEKITPVALPSENQALNADDHSVKITDQESKTSVKADLTPLRQTRSNSKKSMLPTNQSTTLASKVVKTSSKSNALNVTVQENDLPITHESIKNKISTSDHNQLERNDSGTKVTVEEGEPEILPLHIRLGIDRTYSKASPLTIALDEEPEQGESLELSFRLDSEDCVNLASSSEKEAVLYHPTQTTNLGNPSENKGGDNVFTSSSDIASTLSLVEETSKATSLPLETSLMRSDVNILDGDKLPEANSSESLPVEEALEASLEGVKLKTRKSNIKTPEHTSDSKMKTRTSSRKKLVTELNVAESSNKETVNVVDPASENVTHNKPELVLKETTETSTVVESGKSEEKKVNKRRSLPDGKLQDGSAKKPKRVSFGGRGFQEKTADQRFDDLLKITAKPFKSFTSFSSIGSGRRKRGSFGVILATPPKKSLIRLPGTKFLHKYRRRTTGSVPKQDEDSSDDDLAPNVLRTYSGGKSPSRKNSSEPRKTSTTVVKRVKKTTSAVHERTQNQSVKNSCAVNTGIQTSPKISKCQFHICFQGPSPPELRSPNTTYTCKECHYRTCRIENIIHHYKECTLLLNQETLRWEKVGDKTPTRFSQDSTSSSPVTSSLSSSQVASNKNQRHSEARKNLSKHLGSVSEGMTSDNKGTPKSERNEDHSDDSDDLPEVEISLKTTFGFIENDIVWVDWKNDQWPALVQEIYPNEKKALVYLIENQLPEKGMTVHVEKLTTFDDNARNKLFLSKGGPSSSKVKAVQKAEDYLRKRCLGMKINPLPFFNNPDDVQNYLLEGGDSDEEDMRDLSPPPDTTADLELENDKLSNDDPNGNSTLESTEELDSVKLRLKAENRKLLDCIKEGQVEKHLIDVFEGTVLSERHQKFCSSVASVRNQLKHSSWFGPLETEDQRKEIIDYCTKLFESKFEKKDNFDLVAYVFEVWIPEALIQAVMKVCNLPNSEAEACFARGSDWLPQDLLVHQEAEELCCEPLDPLSTKRQKVIEKLRAIGIQEELLQTVPPTTLYRSNTQATS